MRTINPRSLETGISVLVVLILSLSSLRPPMLFGQQATLRQKAAGTPVKLTTQQQQILVRARAILKKINLPEAEQAVRLRILDAAMAGSVMTPADDSPEVRNPKYWMLSNGTFIVSPESTAVEAISDLWIIHENDNVPVPRIWCYKYASLIMAHGFIQYFRDTNNAAGLAALDKLIGHKEFPRGLPNGGDGFLWTRRHGSDNLLPGDQVWFDNPYFERGRELIRQEAYRQAISDGKSAKDAAASADETTNSLAVGEEGSNIFYLGDQTFVRGGCSVSRLFRGTFRHPESESTTVYEQVVNRRIFSLTRFQEHMIDDNYTVQAFMRANPGVVRPGDFTIERVRSPLNPEILMGFSAGTDRNEPLDVLIDAMVSRNEPPKLITLGTTIPLFGNHYDWTEQQRVRSAIDTVLRIRTDDMWWRLRAHLDDRRYVLTATRGGFVENFTLGAMCRDMVAAKLCLAFTSHLLTVPGRLPPTFRPEEEYWKHENEWIQERKPLYEMQIALCERAIAQWETIQQTLPGDDGQWHVYSPNEKARYIAAIKKEIEERKRTKKAVHEEVLLPWRIAPSGWEGFDAESANEVASRAD
jgi:hypothetical protein